MLAGESARVAQTSGGVGGAYVTTKSVAGGAYVPTPFVGMYAPLLFYRGAYITTKGVVTYAPPARPLGRSQPPKRRFLRQPANPAAR